MIARVKIAPVEHWCDAAKASKQRRTHFPIGLEVGIITESMVKVPRDGCGGRGWTLAQESTNALREACGLGPIDTPRQLCEHVLEMD